MSNAKETEEGRRAASALDHEQLKDQQNQRKAAGKKSAIARASGAAKRRLIVKRAFRRLTSEQQLNPYSANTIDALKAAYGRLLIEDGFDLKTLTGPPFKVGCEALRSDLKRLGIRTYLRQTSSELRALLADTK